MSHKNAQIFFEKSQILGVPYLFGDDPRPLQLAFAALFDEAAQAVYRAGADLDEVLVERILIVRHGQRETEVPASFLADAELLKKSVLKHVADSRDATQAALLEIVSVKIIVRHDGLHSNQ